MSLKGFHIVLISLSSLLALGFGGWSVKAYRTTDQADHLAMALISFAGAVGLVVYIIWFARKVRSREEEDRERRKHIRPLAFLALCWLLSSRPAEACSVCYGDAEGPMIDAARLGVWLLFGLVFAVQAALVVFFLCLRRRARVYRETHPDPCWSDLRSG